MRVRKTGANQPDLQLDQARTKFDGTVNPATVYEMAAAATSIDAAGERLA
jgi:hypothetical protein